MTGATRLPENIDRVLDLQAAMAFVQHDHEFLHELVNAFQDYRVRMIERMECSIQQNDAAELREVAHQLKGALGNFHARAAVHTAQQLETVGRQGELRNAESLFATLDHDLEVLSNVLKCLLQELESRARVDH